MPAAAAKRQPTRPNRSRTWPAPMCRTSSATTPRPAIRSARRMDRVTFLLEQIERSREFDDEGSIRARRTREQLVEGVRVGIDQEQAGVPRLQPAEPDVRRPQIRAIVVLQQSL